MDGSFTEFIWNNVAPVLGSLILALISWGLIELKKWVAAKTQNEQVNSALELVAEAVYTVVLELEQTFTRAMKDGKLDESEKAEIKKMALDRVYQRLTPIIIDQARKAIDDFEAWIGGLIETTIFEMKREIKS